MGFRTRLLVPVKNLRDSKTSFSDILTEEQRRKFTFVMLEDVLNVAQRVEDIEPAVVTPDEDVLNFVEEKGIKVILEPDVGLIEALELAIEKSIESGFQQVLFLPVDVPLVRREDLEEILSLSSGEGSVVISPSEEGGTNALLLRPPDVMKLHLGGESFPEHLEEAKAQGIEPRIYRSERLARDIDSPSHLLKVETMGAGTKTHSFIDSLKQES